MKCDITDFESGITHIDDMPEPTVELKRVTLHRAVMDMAWSRPLKLNPERSQGYEDGFLAALRYYRILMEASK